MALIRSAKNWCPPCAKAAAAATEGGESSSVAPTGISATRASAYLEHTQRGQRLGAKFLDDELRELVHAEKRSQRTLGARLLQSGVIHDTAPNAAHTTAADTANARHGSTSHCSHSPRATAATILSRHGSDSTGTPRQQQQHPRNAPVEHHAVRDDDRLEVIPVVLRDAELLRAVHRAVILNLGSKAQQGQPVSGNGGRNGDPKDPRAP